MRQYQRNFRNYFIDKKFQTKYLLLTVLLLVTYTFIFTIILFLPSILTLFLDSSLEEKTVAARTFLALHGTVWPTVIAVIFIFGIFSIFLTHKIAGPVYRLKHALAELIRGNLNTRINLRKWDDLQELAEQVNLLSEDLNTYVTTLKNDHEQLTSYITQLERESCTKTGMEIIAQAQEKNKSITMTLERFTSKS